MAKYLGLVVLVLIFSACSKATYETHDHSAGDGHEEENGHVHGHGGGEIENIRFTEFSDNYELFAEMTPLIKGEESEFVVHYTKLSDFKPITDGSLTIELNGSIKEKIYVEKISRAGIFIKRFTPQGTGDVNIQFIYDNGSFFDTIKVDSQKCYPSMHDAQHDEIPAEEGIIYLKEEAWKVDFALKQINLTDFSETAKATGKVLNIPSEEIAVTASSAGIVQITDPSIIPGKKIAAGQQMFKIKSGVLRDDNLELSYSKAKSDYERFKKDFGRISELHKSKIASEKEFLDAKSSFEKAEAIFNGYSTSSDGKDLSVKTSKAGFIKQIFVKQGEFVEAGATLAIVTNNNRMLLQVDIPSAEYSKLGLVSDANIKVRDKVYKLSELNGKLTGSPVVSGSTSYVSLYFEIENKINLMPNALISVYLLGNNNPNSISIPKESVWEDLGHYFVFVQKHGELYEKREISISGFDGSNYKVGSGINAGEVIVSKGVYKVMLASKSSELPSHSHAH